MLESLLERGKKNGVEGLEILTKEQVKVLEPNVDVAAALHSPNTGVVDFQVVAQQCARATPGSIDNEPEIVRQPRTAPVV